MPRTCDAPDTDRRRRPRWLLAGFLSALACTLALGQARAVAAPGDAGQWGPVFDFQIPGTHQVLLHNGKVLYWKMGDEARVWDPASGSITQTPVNFPLSNFHCSGQVVLSDGRVLLMGGELTGPHSAIKTAGIFDPATNTWTQAPDMHFERWYPTATVLADGRVLVGNGEDNNRAVVHTFEVYDPKANTWTVLNGADLDEPIYSTNYLMPDGRVFYATPGTNKQPTTFLLDMGTSLWAPGPANLYRTLPFSESDAMYAPGKIIRAGGVPVGAPALTKTATNRAAIIDMTAPSPAWQDTAAMAFPRERHNMVILADGTVMAEGGTRQADDPAQADLTPEIWNPATGQWTSGAAMTDPRMYHSAALLLPDGRVLTAGGEPSTAGPTTPLTAQVYSPPYLFKGPRPTISGVQGGIAYGASFPITTPDAAGIDSVALIRPSAVTHAYNMDERYVPLSFTAGPGRLDATAPAGGGYAPPGWYMLVIKNRAGVPSVAAWVQVGGAGAGGGAGGGAGSQPPATGQQPGASARILGLRVASRISLRGIRARGLTVTVRLAPGARVVRARLIRVVSRTHRRTIATVFVTPRRSGVVRLTFRSRTLRRAVRSPGRYVIEVAAGASRGQLTRALRRTFTVVVRR